MDLVVLWCITDLLGDLSRKERLPLRMYLPRYLGTCVCRWQAQSLSCSVVKGPLWLFSIPQSFQSSCEST